MKKDFFKDSKIKFPAYEPWISSEDKKIVNKTLAQSMLTLGPRLEKFEADFCKYSQAKYAIAVSNCTAALHLSLKALGIKKDDEVIVPDLTFVADANAVLACNAKPVIVDINKENFFLSIPNIKKNITKKTKAIIPVHIYGQVCNIDEILDVAHDNNLKVIEDCAHAIGTFHNSKHVGNLGNTGCFSFYPTKNITTAEGGMVTTDSKELWSRMWSYKDHGKSYDAVYNTEHPPGFRWLHESFGTNWRMTEMQAAIGRIQIARMPEWTETRQRYGSMLDEVGKKYECIRTVNVPEYIEHAEYKHYFFVKPEFLKDGWTRDKIVEAMSELKVPCMQGSCSEVYLEKAFDNTPWRPRERLPRAKELGETSLMMLVHPTLRSDEMLKMCEALDSVLSVASK